MAVSNMMTLHEIAMAYATRQPGMIDSLTEETVILQRLKWKPATHGLHNVAEKLTDIVGPGMTEIDAPLPYMQTSSDLVTTNLVAMGGMIEVPTVRAMKLGGHAKYFSDKQGPILKAAGMDLERAVAMDQWMEHARRCGNLYDAGGNGDGWYLMAVRLDEQSNVGLFDPDLFAGSGRFFDIKPMHGGNEYPLMKPEHHGVLGYGCVWRCLLGWQVLDPIRTVAAIVNIDRDNKPSVEMIDDMLAQVRATPASTMLITSVRGRIHSIDQHKRDAIKMLPEHKGIDTVIETWDGIPIIASHNLPEKMPNIAGGPFRTL